jgi:hypothetical protein
LQNVRLTFDSFAVERQYDNGGLFDWVDVYDGPDINAAKIGQYFGGNPPPQVITSTGSSLYINFITDDWIEFNGFKFSWSIG